MRRSPRATPEVPPAKARGATKIMRTPEREVAIGARIRAARVANHMSQGELGAAVGITFRQIQEYENGEDRIAAC